MKIEKRKSLIMVSVVVLIVILGVAVLVTHYDAPKSEEEVFTPENGEADGFPYGAPPFNFTAPEGEFNFTIPEDRFNQPFPEGHNFTFPEGDFNFTIPDDGFNAPFPEGGFDATFPGDGFDERHSPFMGNLTDEQMTILDEKMRELTESGATQEEIIAAMRELMEEFGIQNPPE